MSESMKSRLPGFYNRTPEERLRLIAEEAQLTTEEQAILGGALGLELEQAAHMIENVVGRHALPLGIATNFVVNGREVLVPMVIEEPSVVAGLSFAAKLAREGGGFRAESDPPRMIGQIQLLDVPSLTETRERILAAKASLLELANARDPVLVRLGGGAQDLQVRLLDETTVGPMLVVHLVHDVRDAMGANAVNTACEGIAPELERLSGGRVGLRILSNLADQRLARARCRVPATSLAMEGLSPAEAVQRILEAQAFAEADPYRATTHNKGIMNGIDAVVLATGNDWRAIEAGAHAYAARSGRYTSLSTWRRDGQGHLVGTLELPLALGIVGGATRVHPTARVALKILGIETARALAEVVVSVGLAQNFAALRALATEGIQRGHMGLHARQIAIAAGATGDEIEAVARRMVAEGEIGSEAAARILADLR